MKLIKKLGLVVSVLTFGALLSACAGDAKKDINITVVDGANKVVKAPMAVSICARPDVSNSNADAIIDAIEANKEAFKIDCLKIAKDAEVKGSISVYTHFSGNKIDKYQISGAGLSKVIDISEKSDFTFKIDAP